MQARMNHPTVLLPDAMKALFALKASTTKNGVSEKTIHLVELRASQINGCCACVDMHSRDAKKIGETDERLFAVVAWRESPHFDPAERAALNLAESLTRIADRAEGVPDEVWEDAPVDFSAPIHAGGPTGLIAKIRAARRKAADMMKA